MVYLAEQLAHPVDYLTETLHAPQALCGVVIAVLVATPEAIGATRATKLSRSAMNSSAPNSNSHAIDNTMVANIYWTHIYGDC